MKENVIHDLAVAYAQAKLIKNQQEHPEETGYSEEIRSFLKDYYIAINHIPEENENIDPGSLM